MRAACAARAGRAQELILKLRPSAKHDGLAPIALGRARPVGDEGRKKSRQGCSYEPPRLKIDAESHARFLSQLLFPQLWPLLMLALGRAAARPVEAGLGPARVGWPPPRARALLVVASLAAAAAAPPCGAACGADAQSFWLLPELHRLAVHLRVWRPSTSPPSSSSASAWRTLLVCQCTSTASPWLARQNECNHARVEGGGLEDGASGVRAGVAGRVAAALAAAGPAGGLPRPALLAGAGGHRGGTSPPHLCGTPPVLALF